MKKYSLALRIYHWLTAMVVFLMLGTVVVRNTVFEQLTLAKQIREFLAERSIALNVEDSLALTDVILENVWRFHYYFGIVFSTLTLYRIILFFTPSGREVLVGFKAFVTRKDKSPNAFKYLLYILFYVVSIILSFSGMMMYGLGSQLSESMFELMESLHHGVINVVILFIPIHIAGVLMGEKGEDRGIVSKMINGGQENTNAKDVLQ